MAIQRRSRAGHRQRLEDDGTYSPIETSQFLPIRAEEIRPLGGRGGLERRVVIEHTGSARCPSRAGPKATRMMLVAYLSRAAFLDPIAQNLRPSIRTGTWRVLPFPSRQATIVAWTLPGQRTITEQGEQANGRDE